MAAKWLTKAEAHAWLGFVNTTQLLFDELDRQVRDEADMTHADYQMLALLSQAPQRRLNITALARVMCYSQSRVSHAVARLGRRGWIDRLSDPNDGRGSFAAMTEEGFAALQAAAPGHVAAVRRHLFDQLTPAQVRQLGEICDAALAHLKPHDAASRPPLRRVT